MAKVQLDDNDDKVQKVRNIVNDCTSQTDSDRCEAAAKICDCVQKGCQARDITFSM